MKIENIKTAVDLTHWIGLHVQPLVPDIDPYLGEDCRIYGLAFSLENYDDKDRGREVFESHAAQTIARSIDAQLLQDRTGLSFYIRRPVTIEYEAAGERLKITTRIGIIRP